LLLAHLCQEWKYWFEQKICWNKNTIMFRGQHD